MSRRAVFGTPLTSAERNKLARLRRDGIVTAESSPEETRKLLRTFAKPGPKKTVTYTDAQRKALKRKRGKTITQLREEEKK